MGGKRKREALGMKLEGRLGGTGVRERKRRREVLGKMKEIKGQGLEEKAWMLSVYLARGRDGKIIKRKGEVAGFYEVG